MDRVMLIANPRAGSMSPRRRTVMVKALSADFKLDVEETRSRAHAMEIAAEAVDAGFDAVLALGGDGTINEVAQPLVGTGVALGILPGGSTNVLARSLGIPLDPLEATAFLAQRIRSRNLRRIGVGSVDGRYFIGSVGIGLDAEVVKRVEAEVARTGSKSDATFIKHALIAAATRYRRAGAWLTCRVEGSAPFEAALGIVCNGWPFTYLRGRPVDACPEARLTKRLDSLALRTITVPMIPRVAWSVLVSRGHVRWKRSHYHHDVGEVVWTCRTPHPVQVDGDYIGERDSATVTYRAESLDLLA